MNIIYEGFFVLDTLSSNLEKDIEFKHITTEFKPAKTHEYLYGTEATFVVTGYGNDSVNEGYKVQLVSCDSDELVELYRNILLPHITLSVSKEGKPVNTKNLTFIDSSSLTIRTKFGGYIGKPIFDKELISND